MKKREFPSRLLIACCAASTVFLSGCGGSDSGEAAAQTDSSSTASSSDTNAVATTAAGSSSSSSSTSGAGTVSLAWQPPANNTDGTPISNLAGYEIHYGTTSLDYTATIQVAGAANTSYVVQNLPPDTYYFAVAAYDSAGNESSLSPEISTTVD